MDMGVGKCNTRVLGREHSQECRNRIAHFQGGKGVPVE